jgi:ribonuclease BN (tRNA processing enzyme)
MRLTVVGCAPAYTRRSGRSSSCYLVEHGSTTVVLDLGQGSFSELWRYSSFADVSAVAISHMHADHNVDLIPLRHWVRYANRGYGPALYGPRELRRRLGEYQSQPDFLSDLAGEVLEPRSFGVGDVRLEALPVTHIPDSFAFRVSPATGDGPGLVYSGDCAVADDLVPLIRSGDTVLSEAAFGAGSADGGGHLTARQAAGAAVRGGAGQLILTHILDGRPEADARAAAEATFGGSVRLAEPGLRVEVG